MHLGDQVAEESHPLRPVDRKRILGDGDLARVYSSRHGMGEEKATPQPRACDWHSLCDFLAFRQFAHGPSRSHEDLDDRHRGAARQEMAKIVTRTIHRARYVGDGVISYSPSLKEL